MAVFSIITGFESDKFKTPIVVPFIIVLVVMVGAFMVIAYMFEARDRERDLAENVQAVERLFLREMEKDANIMGIAIDAIVKSKEAKEAFLANDRQALLALAKPQFENLKASHNITHLYFITPDRVTILRGHKPDTYGDIIKHETIHLALHTGKTAQGIEQGKFGTVTLRVVTPWYDDGKLIGYVELGKEIQYIAEEIHQILGLDLAILIYKAFLDQENWETGLKTFGRPKMEEWDRFEHLVIVGQTMDKIPKGLVEILSTGHHSYTSTSQMNEDGKVLNTAFLPLFDIAGREIGDIIVVRDVSLLQFTFQDSIALIASLSLLAMGIAFSLFSVILRRVELVYHRQKEVETEFSKLTTEHQRIVQTEKLSAMGMMIGEIAHQINNPLVGVVNMAQLAQREVDDAERMHELLGDIRLAGEHCRAFVQRMLEFSTISHSERRPTDMKNLIEETISLFHQSAGKRMTVATEMLEESLTLDVDPILIRHALFNLLTNAAQVCELNDPITVRLNRTDQTESQAEGWCLSVVDQGPGLGEDIIDNIFTPFFSTRPEGTGLGLPVVQHIAIAHGGQITATNNIDGGACFALWLPDSKGEDEGKDGS